MNYTGDALQTEEVSQLVALALGTFVFRTLHPYT